MSDWGVDDLLIYAGGCEEGVGDTENDEILGQMPKKMMILDINEDKKCCLWQCTLREAMRMVGVKVNTLYRMI